MRRALGGG
jgi:uncharacterized membrane protein YgcG